MSTPLTITVTDEPVLTMHLSGRLDTETHEMLLEAARAAHAAGARRLLLDLSDIEFITSAGLGTIQRIFKLFTPAAEMDAWVPEDRGEPYKSPYFKMACAPPDVYYILNLAGFVRNIYIFPDLPGALKSFAG